MSRKTIRLSFILIIIYGLSYSNYVFAQNTSSHKTSKKAIVNEGTRWDFVSEDEILKKDILDLKKKVGNLKNEIEEIKKINLSSEVEKRLLSLKEYAESVDNHHESIVEYIGLVQLLKGIIIFILLVIGSIIGWIIWKNKKIINWLVKDIKEECYRKTEEEVNRVLISLDIHQGYLHYTLKDHHDGLSHAIYFTKKALNRAKHIFGEKLIPKDGNEKNSDEELIGVLLGNLIYYNVEKGDLINYDTLIKIAKRVFEIGENLGKIRLIDDYLFVMSKFASKITKADKEQALSVLDNYMPQLIDKIGKTKIEEYKSILSFS